MKQRTIYLLLLLFAGCHLTVIAQNLSKKYNKERPVVVVCDWDKAPYESLNVNGDPAGFNVDMLRMLMDELNLPVTFVMKDWVQAMKTFERGDADLILANSIRFLGEEYTASSQIINYNRVKVAMARDTSKAISLKTLKHEGVVLKAGDYSTIFFMDDSTDANLIEYQSPKVALLGLISGDNKYFLWGEEPLRWKIKELGIDGVYLNDVGIPVSEVRIIGRDKELIYQIDDCFSRLKQRGDIEDIRNKWFHPERVKHPIPPAAIYITIGGLLLTLLLMLFSRLAKNIIKEAIRKSNELNKMIYRALDMGNFNVIVYDIRCDRFTNQYGSMLPVDGLSLEAFVARLHPTQKKEFQQKMQLLIEGRERKFDIEKRWNAGSEASPHWLVLHSHAISELDNLGHPAYIINALHDTTQDLKDDRADREIICKYNTIINTPGLAMSFHDGNGRLITVNKAMNELYGFEKGTAGADIEHYWRSMNLFDIFIFRNAITPTSRDPLKLCRHITFDEIGIDRYVETHITPVFDKDGHTINFFGTSVDISEERQLDAAIHRQNRELNQTKSEIESLRQHLEFLLVNTRRYLWRSDIRQQQLHFFRQLGEAEVQISFDAYLQDVAADDQECATRLLNATGPLPTDAESSIVRFQHTILSPEESWFKIVGQPYYDAAGQLLGHQGIFVDITRLIHTRQHYKEMKRLAEDSVRMKSGFMASMTHELRTPLNAIVGFTSVLSALGDSPERGDYVKIIRNSSDMLQRLINDIIEASSFTEGRLSIVPQDVDFAEAFDDICITLNQRVEQLENVEFQKENPYEHFLTHLDIGRVKQLLINFVTNAVKFTEKGHIRVGYRYDTDHLHLYCEDTGKGIAREKQESVFQRFVKLDEFTQGTGMGLTICKSITQQMGGTIGLSSEGEGRGSTFWVDIPCKQL